MGSLINFLLFLVILIGWGVVFSVLGFLLDEKTTIPAWVAISLAATLSYLLLWAVIYLPEYLRYGFFLSNEPVAQITPFLLTLGFLVLSVAAHYTNKAWNRWNED